MGNRWVSPKTITGNIATGDYYYSRPELEQEIIDEIKKGNHILIAAPRRYGKTSIVVHLSDNCPKGFNCVFENIQGILSEKHFYKRFYELMLSSLNNNTKLKQSVKTFLISLGVKDVSTNGKVTFTDRKDVDYLAEINKLLPLLKDNELKLVLFIDELPEVLHNLHKEGKNNEARGILKNIRRWRQMDNTGSLCLVFTGSVGIHHVVKTIESRTTDLNDMVIVDFEPFDKSQAIEFIQHFTKDASVIYDTVLSEYLIEKISYPIPFFINLMLNQINKTAKKRGITEINIEDIDNAFDAVIQNNDYFVEWKRRLFDYYPKTDAALMNEVLVFIAHENKISIKQIYNLAVKYEKTITYMDLIEDMVRDGYIFKIENNYYIFVSPFLKAFWKRNQPIYNG